MSIEKINALTCSDDFDFVFADDGTVSVEMVNSGALVSMLKLDFTSNDDWSLDSDLGMHWISKSDDGYLQVKRSEESIAGAISRKLNSIKGIREIKEIEMQRGINRMLNVRAVVITDNGDVIEIGKEF